MTGGQGAGSWTCRSPRRGAWAGSNRWGGGIARLITDGRAHGSEGGVVRIRRNGAGGDARGGGRRSPKGVEKKEWWRWVRRSG